MSAPGLPKFVRHNVRSKTARIGHPLDLEQNAPAESVDENSRPLAVNALGVILNIECNALGIRFAHKNTLEPHGHCEARLVFR